MTMGARIGIGVAVLAVLAGGGWIYAGSVATARAEQALEDLRADLPPGTTLTVEGLSASPLGAASIDAFTMALEDGSTLRGGPATASGGADRVESLDMADLVLTQRGTTVTVGALALRDVAHPDFDRLSRTLAGEADGYADPVAGLRALSVGNMDLGDVAVEENGEAVTLAGLSVADMADGVVGRITLENGSFQKGPRAAVIGRASLEDLELADAVGAVLAGADEEDVMAVTGHGAFEVAGVTAREDGTQVFSVERFALEDPVHVGDLIVAGTFVLEGLVFDPRQKMGSAELGRMRDVLGPAADEPIRLSGRIVSTYGGGKIGLETLNFEAEDLGRVEMSLAATNYDLDPATFTNVSAEQQRAALLEAALGAAPQDMHLTISHSGWVHEAIRQEAGGPEAARQQAAMMGMVFALGASPVVGQDGARALADGIAALLTDKTTLAVSLDNPQGLAVREVAMSGGDGAIEVSVDAR